MRRGDLNGWSYSYTDEGAGPPLIFNHGILMDRSIWEEQIDDLKDSYRCLAIDAPGHGESSPAAMGIDFYEYGDMLTEVAQQLGIEQAVWLGQSMGGFINLRLALRHPDKVKGLVLIDTQAHSEDADKRAQYEAFLKVSLEDGVGEDLANILIMLLFGETFAGRPESDVWRKKLMTQDIKARHAMVRAVFERDDVHDRLGEIRVPALVIHGREDVAIEPERAEELARDLPDATVQFIDECGHCSPHERGAAVTKHVRSFLERIGY
jgi:pimeloyl-ACP methyl ester carboxylesterase